MTVINLPQLSLDIYIALSLVIATPWLYYLFSTPKPSKIVSLLLLIHTLYILHALLVSQPRNIFKSLDLPPNVPADYLRERLVERLGVIDLPPYLDVLLKRLGSMDFRSLYFRYVHNLTPCLFFLTEHSGIALDMMSLQRVHIVSHSMILLFTLSLHLCWNTFVRLDSLAYCFYFLSTISFHLNFLSRPSPFPHPPRRTFALLALAPSSHS